MNQLLVRVAFNYIDLACDKSRWFPDKNQCIVNAFIKHVTVSACPYSAVCSTLVSVQ